MSRASTRRFVSIVGSVLLAIAAPALAQTDPHAGHEQAPKPAAPATPAPADTHEHPDQQDQKRKLPPFIPPVTDADRKAAFPDLEGHAVHDEALNYFILFDQFEWQSGEGTDGLSLDARGWVGLDRDRLWFRAEGDGANGRVEEAQTHLLYGRHISRWWDLVGGVRQDFRPGSAQTWAAFGVQGLAPVLVRNRGYRVSRPIWSHTRARRG